MQEDNFLYLNVSSSPTDVDLTPRDHQPRSNARAKRTGWAGALEAISSQWHATAELNEGEIELTSIGQPIRGPAGMEAGAVDPIDEAHATELLGTLALALEKKRQLATEPPG
jgi:hypothetical protein